MTDAVVWTMDTDWVSPEVVDYVFDRIIDPRTQWTAFCTECYSTLDDRDNVETALHYSVEKLGFEGGFREIQSQLPRARGARGHSMAISERLRPLYAEFGIRFDSSYLMPAVDQIVPFRIAQDVWEFPLYFMDAYFLDHFNGDLSSFPTADDFAAPGLKVLDFHPVHLVLNTPSLEFYYSVKQHFQDLESLLAHQHRGYGIRNYLLDLQSDMLSRPVFSPTMSELVQRIDSEIGPHDHQPNVDLWNKLLKAA